METLTSSQGIFPYIYQSVSQTEAMNTAAQGGLTIIALKSTTERGHFASFSVGENISKGTVANIGGHNGFLPLSNAFKSKDIKNLKYYIIK
jgi:hypothetical protein